MITQYVSSSTLPSYISDYLTSHIGVFDKYVGFYTGQNSIDFLVSPAFGDSYLLHFSRDGSYNSSWEVSSSSAEFAYTYSNSLFVYDNLGIGHELTSSHVDSMLLCALVFVLILITLFKAGWTKWLRG